MIKIIKSRNIEDPNKVMNIQLDLPNQCPYCLDKFNPKGCDLDHFHILNSHKMAYIHYSIILCPSCEDIFCSEYSINKDSLKSETQIAKFLKTIPNNKKIKCIFHDGIMEMSPRFCEIYQQSLDAESDGLAELCGMGYRKAIEILVKDYAKFFNRNDIDKIEKRPLGQCINEYLDNPKLKSLLKTATWIGNDETHYKRKYEFLDIQKMKSFIGAALPFIESDLAVVKAQYIEKKKNNDPESLARIP